MIRERLERVRERMRAHGFDQIIVTQPQAIYYLTGLWCNPMERLDALIVTQERCRMLCYVLAVIEPEDCEVTVYADTGVTVDRLSGLLERGETGVDGFLASRFLLPLMDRRPDLRLRVSSCVEEARMIKTEEEIRLLRRASEVTDAVFMEAFPLMREGMTELEFGAVFSDLFLAHGAGRIAGDPMVSFAAGTAEPHHDPGQTALRPGDTVWVDIGKRIGGYHSDMTRCVFFRSADEEQRRVYQTVLEANLAGLAAVRPGALLSDVHEAACRVIREAGYGGFYPHRTSHGIGIDCHEEPFDVVGKRIELQEGMCFSVEPGVYLPGRFGVRIEDLVVVTKDGYSLLTHAPKELTVI
ncbi:MAG: aminopeptidase P family protein [Clostridia bacterium]|nr:aminopeptidase P family protein [Clostridia bacterium]